MSSVLKLNQIQSSTSNLVTLTPGTLIGGQNQIVQCKYIRTDQRAVYSAPNNGNGTPVIDLNLTITPTKANSLMIIKYMINGEMHHDTVWLMHRDGNLITVPNFEGYNSERGNVRDSGIAPQLYDRNEDTTPTNWYIQYAVLAEDTSPRSYSPAVRSSNTNNRSLYLNRVVERDTGSDAREMTVSTGIVMEVLQ